MITLLFIVFGAFFNAVMDAVENENFHESIFKKLPFQFWYKRESWKYVPRWRGYRFDAWHISKTLTGICLFMAIYSERYSNQAWHTGIIWLDILIDVIISITVWNTAFTLFYHKVFKVK